jgi:hypothetical protein
VSALVEARVAPAAEALGALVGFLAAFGADDALGLDLASSDRRTTLGCSGAVADLAVSLALDEGMAALPWLPDSRASGTSLVLGVRDGLQVIRVDAAPVSVTAQVIELQALGNRADVVLVRHPMCPNLAVSVAELAVAVSRDVPPPRPAFVAWPGCVVL